MNYFAYQTAAERYAKGRPWFHPLVMRKISEFTGCARFEHALDVCCGTGLSTRALLEIADSVTGTDLSQEMLDFAPTEPGLSYVCCPAEDLPFDDGAFDLLTVALGFHWLDRSRFLKEAYRVLREEAWLVIYQNGFFGTMNGNPEFEKWMREHYFVRYPNTPRDRSPFTKEDAAEFGFEYREFEKYTNEVEFTLEELICYLSTQSNMIASIEEERETAEEALAWLESELAPLFRSEPETFPFGGTILYLRRNAG